ncbi:MAG: prepilin peptidase [Candidatus Nealsonbacteria bacterium]|nr:prepilin peptidase [Candidatus Nealsonbacteria bacterium]
MFLVLILFLIGIIIGSFLNCLIYRLEIDYIKRHIKTTKFVPQTYVSKSPLLQRREGGVEDKGRSFLRGHSYCPDCKHILSWIDLIPILSFWFLKGKCRYCSKKISWQYPLVEAATGLLFLLVFYFQPSPMLSFSYYLIISCFLIVVFVYDLKHYIIPDKIIYPAIGLSLFYQLLKFLIQLNENGKGMDFGLVQDLGFGILPSLFFLAIILHSRGQWMGFGDFKLAILMGLILGWPDILVALFLAFLIGALVGLGLIILRKKTLKSEIPFAPFLVTGTFIAMFLGRDIFNWFL